MTVFSLINVAVPASARSVVEEALKRRGLIINPSGELTGSKLIWLPTRDGARRLGRLVVHADQRVLLGQKPQALT